MPERVKTRERGYLPALRFPSLTRFFDPIARGTTRERTFKPRLLDRASVAPGESVLDLGAGTGTLAILLKDRVRGARVTGLDADPEMLSQARRKAAEAGLEIELVEGFSTALPFPGVQFDVVLSTLFFHHLPGEDKQRTLTEVFRVLKPGGRIHVADWGKPSDPLMRAAFLFVRVFDGFEVTADNASGALPAMFEQAGLEAVTAHERFRTPVGTLVLYEGRKPYEANRGGEI